MYAFGDAYAAYRRVLDLVEQVPHDLDRRPRYACWPPRRPDLVGEPDRGTRAARAGARRHRRPAHPRARRRAARRAAPHRRRRRRRASGPSPRRSRLLPDGRDQRARGAGPGAGWRCWRSAGRGWTTRSVPATEALRIARAVGARREEGIGAQRPRARGGAPRRPRPGGATAARGAGASRARSRTPRTSARPTSTSATCSGWPAGSTSAWSSAAVGIVELTRFGQQRVAGQPAAEQRQRDPGGGRPVRRGRRAGRPRR